MQQYYILKLFFRCLCCFVVLFYWSCLPIRWPDEGKLLPVIYLFKFEFVVLIFYGGLEGV